MGPGTGYHVNIMPTTLLQTSEAELLRVLLDGAPRGTIKLPRGGDVAVHTLDLSAGLAAGRHRVQLVPLGKGSVLYRIEL